MRKLTLAILSALLLLNICSLSYAQTVESTGGIFVNEDGTNTISRPFDRVEEYNIDDKDSTKKALEATMHDYAGTQVTDVSVCANYRASLAKSDVIEDTKDLCEGIGWDVTDAEQIKDKAYEYFYKINYTHGLDVHRIWFEQLKQDKIRAWISFRMNDVHAALGDNTNGNTHFGLDAFKNKLTIGSHYDSALAGYVDCLDYSKKEVRDKMLGYIVEQMTNYNDVLEGIELDFLRESFCFAPGKEAEGRTIMTQFIADVKNEADKYGLKITVRLPRDFVQCYDSGLDVLEWAKEGLVSSVTVSPRVETCDSDMPIASWVKLLKNYNVTVNAGTDILYRSGGAGRNDSTKRFTNLENDYAQAMAYLSEGADKLYLFNHYSSWYDGYNQPFDQSDVADFGTRKNLLNNAGSTQTLINQNRSYIVSYQDITGNLYEDMYKYDPLPAVIKSGESVSFRIKTGAIPENAVIAVVAGVTEKDAFKTGESAKPTDSDVRDFGNELDITSGDKLLVTVNENNHTNAVDVFCEGVDTPNQDKNYGKLGSKYWKYKYRLPKTVSTGEFDAYAYEFAAVSMDSTEQIVTLTNKSDAEMTLSYVELRVIPEKNSDDYILVSGVDYDSAVCVSGGMTECVETRSFAKIYKEDRYSAKEKLTYKITPKKEGKYKAYIYGETTTSSAYSLTASFADGQSATFAIPPTASHRFARVEVGDFYLYDGQNELTLDAITDGMAYVDSIEFIRIGDLPNDSESVAVPFDSFDENKSSKYTKGTQDVYMLDSGVLTYNFTTRLSGGIYRMKTVGRASNAGKVIRYSVDGNLYAAVVDNDGYATVDVALTGTQHTLILYSAAVNVAGISLECSSEYADTKHIGLEGNAKTGGNAGVFTVSSGKYGAKFTTSNTAVYTITVAEAGNYALKAVYGMKEKDAGSDGKGGTAIQGKLTIEANNQSIDAMLNSTRYAWGAYTYSLADLSNVVLTEGVNTITLTYGGETEFALESLMLDLN